MASKRVLIVEDEGITALMLASQLHTWGMDVKGAVATGEEAIKIAEETPLDYVLMDIQLGGIIDGIQTAREITRYHAVSIIFITGYADADVMDRTKDLNVLAFLPKPLQLGILRRFLVGDC